MSMLFGKTILITGVASGIGARAAELAGQLGADVIGVDLREPAGHQGVFVKADISSKVGVDDLVSQLPQRIDALCNVAGLSGNTGAAATLASTSTACGRSRRRWRQNFAKAAPSSTSPRSPVSAGAPTLTAPPR